MYYIMNEKKQIIAVDNTILELLHVKSNELFMQKIAGSLMISVAGYIVLKAE